MLLFGGVFSLITFLKKAPKGPKNPFEKDDFNTQYKKKVVSKLVEFYDSNLKYDIEGNFPIYTYQVRSFGPYHKLTSSDYITGKIDGKIPIYMADIVVKKDNTEEYQKTTNVLNTFSVATGNFGNVKKAPDNVEELVFSGLYAAVPIRMPRAQIVKLIPQHAIYIKDDICEKVSLDSIELEKNFECFTTDKMYTMSIFTSEVIECINNYKRKIQEPLDVVIGGNYLSIRIAANDVFEGVESKEVLDYEVLYKYFCYIDFICVLSKLIVRNTERYADSHDIKKVSHQK